MPVGLKDGAEANALRLVWTAKGQGEERPTAKGQGGRDQLPRVRTGETKLLRVRVEEMFKREIYT